MFKGLKFSPLLVAVLLAIGLLVYLYLPHETVKKERKQEATRIVLYQVQEAEFEVVVEALGTAKANESVLLTAQQTDIVQRIEFEDGENVKQGQLLLKLNDREEIAHLNELDINLQEAQRQLKRITNLAKESAASEQLLDAQQAKVNAIVAQKEVANAQLAELELRAPFAGKLGIRQVSLGSLVRPGDLITTLDDLHLVKVDFNIAESHLPSVTYGQLIRAKSIAYPGEIFVGKITSIDSRVNPITRSIQIRASIDNLEGKLRPGMLMQIDLQKQILNTLVVPEAALLPIEDKQYVYVVVDGIAHFKEVVVGRRKPGIAQILSGLKVGDEVVVEGALKLRDGSLVTVLNTAKSQG